MAGPSRAHKQEQGILATSFNLCLESVISVPRVCPLYPVAVPAVRYGEPSVFGSVVVPAVDHPRLHPVVREHVRVQLEGAPSLATGEPDLDPEAAT